MKTDIRSFSYLIKFICILGFIAIAIEFTGIPASGKQQSATPRKKPFGSREMGTTTLSPAPAQKTPPQVRLPDQNAGKAIQPSQSSISRMLRKLEAMSDDAGGGAIQIPSPPSLSRGSGQLSKASLSYSQPQSPKIAPPLVT